MCTCWGQARQNLCYSVLEWLSVSCASTFCLLCWRVKERVRRLEKLLQGTTSSIPYIFCRFSSNPCDVSVVLKVFCCLYVSSPENKEKFSQPPECDVAISGARNLEAPIFWITSKLLTIRISIIISTNPPNSPINTTINGFQHLPTYHLHINKQISSSTQNHATVSLCTSNHKYKEPGCPCQPPTAYLWQVGDIKKHLKAKLAI